MLKEDRIAVSLDFQTFETDNRVIRTSTWLRDEFDKVFVLAIHREGLPFIQKYGKFVALRFHVIQNTLVPIRTFFNLVSYLINSYLFIKKRRVELIIANDAIMLPIAWLLKFSCPNSCDIVYDAHEFHPSRPGKGWKLRLRNLIVPRLEKIFIRSAKACVTVGVKLSQEYERIYPGLKFHVVYNIPYYKSITPVNLRKLLPIPSDARLFMTHGWVRYGRGIEIAIEYFKVNECDHFVVMGRGEKLVEIVKECSKKYKNIHYLPYCKPQKVLNFVHGCDFGISFIKNDKISYKFSMPNKFFEYMHCEKPIIVCGEGEQTEIVDSMGNGISTKRYDIQSFSSAIKNLKKLESYKYSCVEAKREFDQDENKSNWLSAVRK